MSSSPYCPGPSPSEERLKRLVQQISTDGAGVSTFEGISSAFSVSLKSLLLSNQDEWP